jgi:hypothetical protein
MRCGRSHSATRTACSAESVRRRNNVALLNSLSKCSLIPQVYAPGRRHDAVQAPPSATKQKAATCAAAVSPAAGAACRDFGSAPRCFARSGFVLAAACSACASAASITPARAHARTQMRVHYCRAQPPAQTDARSRAQTHTTWAAAHIEPRARASRPMGAHRGCSGYVHAAVGRVHCPTAASRSDSASASAA